MLSYDLGRFVKKKSEISKQLPDKHTLNGHSTKTMQKAR